MPKLEIFTSASLQKQKLNSARVLQQPLMHLGNFLPEFIQVQPFPMTVKDSKTRRYCLVNTAAASLYGLTPEAYNGFTFDDIAKLNGLNPNVIQNMAKWDMQVCLKKNSVQFQQILLTCEQFIRVETIVKQPILDEHHQVIAILDSSQNHTPFADLNYLFALYQQYHSTKLAIRHFLRYLELEGYFYKFPTKQELITLLTLRKAVTAQQAALKMGVSSRTVEEYKARLHCKLKVNLHELLFKLRACYEDQTLLTKVTH